MATQVSFVLLLCSQGDKDYQCAEGVALFTLFWPGYNLITITGDIFCANNCQMGFVKVIT